MGPERLSLKWSQYQENFKAAFRDMRSDGDFTDVTLVCENEVTVKAHRVILSSCSSFFKAALRRKARARQRRLYLRGMRGDLMEAAMDFIYLGEVTLAREEVEEFLSLGMDLG